MVIERCGALKKALLFFLLFGFLSAKAQHTAYRFRSLGGLVGYGAQVGITETYKPLFFVGDFCWQIGRGDKKTFFAFYAEPQFNSVKTDAGNDYETGCNIGLRYIKKISSAYIYGMLGSGPHYISAHLARQATGFIFSDNLGIGVLKKIHADKPLALHFQFIARHISNANFVLPNGGINTLNVRIGISGIR